MSIKIGTDTVSDVVYKQGTTNYTVTLIKDSNGQVYYARPGVLDIVLGDGVSGYSSLNRTVTLEPTSSTGAISASSTIYHGDQISIQGTADTYWVPITHSCTIDLLNSTTYTTTLTAYRECNNATVKIGSNVASYKIQYANSSGAAVTTSGVTSATATYSAWRASPVTITPTGATNYTCSPITKAIGWTTFTETLTATPWLYRLTIPNVAGANIKYFYHDGTSAKTDQTTEGTTVNAWKGHDAGYTWYRDTYYTLGGTTHATWTVSGDYTIPAPTVSRYMKNVAVNLSHVTKASVSYATASGTTTVGVTSSTNVNAWTGAAVQWTSATAETNWTIAQSGSIAAGEGDRVLSISASRVMRTITIPSLADATVVYTYSNSGGESTTGSTENTTVQAWQGQNFSYLWTRTPTYYTLSGTSSGSFTVSADTTISKPSVVPYNRDVTVTVKPGVASIVSTYHSDPSHTVTTGTSQTSSYYAWTGGSFDWTVTLQSYWTLSATSGSIAASESARSLAPTPTTVVANAQVIRGSNVDSYKIEYYNSTPTAVTTSGITTTTVNYSAWRGAQVKITPTPATNYTASPITKAVGWTAFTETLTASRWMYSITIPSLDNATVTYTYTNSSGGSVTGTTENTSVSAWKGSDFSFQWARASYWTLSGTSSQTFTVTGATTIAKPTVSRYMKNVAVQLSNVTSADVSYATVGGGAAIATVTTNTNVNAWTGAKVEWISATAATNWTVAQSGSVAAGEGDRVLTISATRLMHAITIPNVANATVVYTYSNSSGDSSTGTAENTSVSAWHGHDFSYTWTRASYYKVDGGTTNDSFTVTQSATIGTPSISPWVKSVPVVNSLGLTKLKVTYQTTPGASAITYTTDTAGSVNAWTGSTLTWSATVANYYTMTSTSGTIAPSEGDRSVIIAATRVTHNFTVYTSGQASGYWLQYVDGSGSTQTVSGTGSVTKTVWNGGKVIVHATADTSYYTYTTYTYDPIGTTGSLTVSAAYWMYNITVPNITNATVGYGYYNNSGSYTWETAGGVTVSAWKNHNFIYQWYSTPYYTFSATGSGGGFTVTQSTTIPTVTVTRKMRKVYYSGTGSADLFYYDSTGGYACSTVSSGYIEVWCGKDATYYLPTSYSSLYYTNTTGTIAAQDTTTNYTITPNLRTFTLGTYTYGTITYYSDSSMTKTITSGNYDTIYNKAYYKYTRNGWYFALMSGTTLITYTNVLSGVVTTTPASTTSQWYGMASEPPAGSYAKVTISHDKRGAVYYKPSTISTYRKLSSGTLTNASSTVYMSSGTTYHVYANYIGYQGSLDGGSTATYGNASDAYTSSANPRSISINTSTITAAFNGSLKSRSIIVNRNAGSHFTATMSYINTSGISTSTKIVGIDYARATSTYYVWSGSNVTITHSTISSPWSTVSGYNISSIAHGTSSYTLTYRTAYDYVIHSKSVTSGTNNLSFTITYTSTCSYFAQASFGTTATRYLMQPTTSTGTKASGMLSTTYSGSYRYFTASASFTTGISATGYNLRKTMVQPTWVRYSDDIWRLYNPYDTTMNISGPITMNYSGGSTTVQVNCYSIAAGGYAETMFCNGASASSWESWITIAIPGGFVTSEHKTFNN